MTGRTKLL